MPSSVYTRRSFLLSSAACLSLVSASARALSQDKFPAPAKNAAPSYPLRSPPDSWEAFKAYSPQKDPDAIYYRSSVPRAHRADFKKDFQPHPELSPQASGASLVAAYLNLDGSDDDLNRSRYLTDTDHIVHVERAWQYLDVVVGWNSTGLVPNPALTDAAHRNGLLSLGTIFQPDKRMFDGSDLPLKDVAARLVDLPQYFGFDGYFVNFEGHDDLDARKIHDLIEQMRLAAKARDFSDFYIQFYNGYTNYSAVWPGPPHADGSKRKPNELRANSMMLDQGWSNYSLPTHCCSGPTLSDVSASVTGADFPGIGDVYYGLQLYPGPGYLGLIAPTVITPNGGPAYGSLQIYSVDDGLRKMRKARLDAIRAATVPTARQKAEFKAFTDPATRRNAWYEQHLRFWSGQSGNPAHDNAPSPEQMAIYGPANVHKSYSDYDSDHLRSTDQMRLPITYGVANFITERSAATRLPFLTRFNTGEGDAFWRQGEKTDATGWFNLGCQDLLPTWAWWTIPLRADSAASLTIDYDYACAFDGGTSLKIIANLPSNDGCEVRLYRTALPLTSVSELDLVYQLSSVIGQQVDIGLSFDDAPQSTEWLSLKPERSSDLTNGWRRWRCSLAAYAGRTLARIALRFKGADASGGDLQLRLGQLAILDAEAQAPPSPEGAYIERLAFNSERSSAALGLVWKADASVKYYDIVAKVHQGLPKWLGRISGDCFYVSNLKRPQGAANSMVDIIPTGFDGTEAFPTSLEISWDS
jgi:endo-beta-N-acetylglucosaminidase D